MFYTFVDSPEEYNKIVVDDRVFYEAKKSDKPRRRYSDQFKDPGFKARELCRKLAALKKAREDGSLDKAIARLEDAIIECTKLVEAEEGTRPSDLYRYFQLNRFDFDRTDFGMSDEDFPGEEY